MSKFLFKYVSLVRTNWKKSTLGCMILGYGGKYGHDQYEIHSMMRGFCEEASLLGDAPAGMDKDASQITVILNPAANRRKAKKNFEKYCAPLLHLSGAYVTVVETTHEGHARKIPDELDVKTTAVIVAGGDGTVSETVTGMMRGRNEVLTLPIGVLPLGRYNTLASHLFPSSATPTQVEKIASATMAVLRGKTRKLNAYRVETLDGEGSEKAIYGVGWLEWGTWPWLKKRCKELWYWGAVGRYIPLLWPIESALKPAVECSVLYMAPCHGCSTCYKERADLMASPLTPKSLAASQSNRWWAAFIKKPQHTNSAGIDYKHVENETCGQIEKKTVYTTNLRMATDSLTDINSSDISQPPSIILSIGERSRYQAQFLYEGLKYLKGEEIVCTDLIQAKQIEIRPTLQTEHSTQESDKNHNVLLIDNEEFELRPIRVTILPNSLTVFCN